MSLSPEKHELLERVQEAINSSGWQLIFENDEHPCMIRALRGNESIRMLVYIWRLTRGGPPGIRPTGEFRIQLTGVPAPLRAHRRYTTLLLGWHEAHEVFAGFDVSRRPPTWGSSPSVQIRETALREAARKGFGVYQRATGTGELAIAFTPPCFMDYVRNQAQFHEFADHPEEVTILDSVIGEEDEDVEEEPDVDLDQIGSDGRRTVVRTVKERIGQENFRARVLAAYRRHCAMCSLQLNLVIAAHIVPVAVEGTNETCNGLALCHLHHEAYDRGFVVADGEHRILVNQLSLRRLRRIKRNSKEQEFLADLRGELRLPERQRDYPSPDYLRRGMEVRGWPAA